jgi:hypothetical protein
MQHTKFYQVIHVPNLASCQGKSKKAIRSSIFQVTVQTEMMTPHISSYPRQKTKTQIKQIRQ